MRVAWQRKNSTDEMAVKLGGMNSLLKLSYNAIWWIPILLAFIGTIDYSTGFITFIAITLGRLSVNLYLNNVLTLEQAECFPFRT